LLNRLPLLLADSSGIEPNNPLPSIFYLNMHEETSKALAEGTGKLVIGVDEQAGW
jgi:hypothetical protein